MKNRILVVEDSPTQALHVGRTLESAGYTVFVASDGQKGLEIARKMTPELIVLDVVLPDMDGFSICQHLRNEIPPHIPVLILTGLSEVCNKVYGLEMGANDYLTKPFDERELLARVASLLRTKRLQDELEQRIKKEQLLYNELKKIAITDHLTGLYNRYYFTESLQREFDTAVRYNMPLACIMADIDHFRDFNTRYGHTIGDWVLQGIARMLMENIRRADIIARYGGEEFIILQPMCNKASSFETAERLRKQVEEQTWESPAGLLQITISLGIAEFPDINTNKADDLINYADRALYHAKEQGRNRVVVFERQDTGKETS